MPVSPSLLGETFKLANPDPFLWLLEVRVPSTPESMIRITPHPTRVQYGYAADGTPLSYDPFPMTMGTQEQDSEGGTPEFTVTVGGATREIMALLLQYGYLVDQPVSLLLVHRAHLHDPTAHTRYGFTVSSVNGDTTAITFVLSSDGLYNWTVPGERITRDFCGFTYKDRRCGFGGDPTNTLGPCPRTYAGCERVGAWEVANGYAQQHPMRFGGAPALLQ